MPAIPGNVIGTKKRATGDVMNDELIDGPLTNDAGPALIGTRPNKTWTKASR